MGRGRSLAFARSRPLRPPSAAKGGFHQGYLDVSLLQERCNPGAIVGRAPFRFRFPRPE